MNRTSYLISKSLKPTFAVAVIAAALSAHSHPYASGLTNSAGTIKFILNEAANDVKVIFDGGVATNDLGALSSGVQSFSLGGHTSYSIVVNKTGSGVVSQISVDGTLNDFVGPRGVAVNRNPPTRNFGRVYVASSGGGSDGIRTTQKGVYVLNADCSDALGYGALPRPFVGAAAGQIQYGSSTNYSPYKVFVGPDDMVYIADAGGAIGSGPTVGGGVWMVTPDLTSATDLFVYNGTTTGAGLVCVPGTPNVFGSVASNNLVLYTGEWNRPPYNNIWEYQMGSGPFPWTNAPIQLASEGITNVNMVTLDLNIAPDGKFFASEYRASAINNNVSLRVFASDGLTLLWDSYDAGGGTDPFVNTHSVAVSPDDKYVAMGLNSGGINLCKLTNGIPDLSTLTSIAAGFGGPCHSVAWDAADNLYGVAGTPGNDLLRIFSLGLITTAVTSNDSTATNGTFQFAIGTNNLPSITVNPVSQTIYAGLPAQFSVTASGPTALSYQWQFNSNNLADNTQFTGSLSNTLSLASVQTNNAGPYAVVVTDSYGSVTSQVAMLTVTTPSNQIPIVWTQFANSPGPNNVRHDDISFTDPTNGWASQNNLIYRTTNGGATWTTCLNLPGTHFRSVAFSTPLIGFAGNLGIGSYDSGVTNGNILYRTIDGGVTWSNVPGFAEAGMQGLCSIDVLDSQHIYGGGRVRGTNAFVIISTNGGFNWNIVNLSAQGVMNAIMDIYFSDPTNGWVAGMDTHSYYSPPYYGRIARTTDGGNTWTTVVTTPVANSYFWKMSWPSPNIGYVSLQQNASFNNVIFYKTVDGGNNWVSNGISLAGLGLGSSAFYLQGLGFVSTNEGWIGGASGSIAYSNSFLHTVDGGVTWQPAGFNDTFFINRIRFLSPTLGFAAGANLYTFSVPLAIATQPQGAVVNAGTNVNLFVAAAGIQPIGYQWLKNGTARPGATNPNLTLTNVTRIDAGTYSVVVTNSAAGLQSSNAIIRVLVPERLAAPILLPGNQLQITFSDADGGNLITTNDLATFTVQVSTNLSTWATLTNALSITNGMVLLTDTFTNSPMQYYRITEH